MSVSSSNLFFNPVEDKAMGLFRKTFPNIRSNADVAELGDISTIFQKMKEDFPRECDFDMSVLRSAFKLVGLPSEKKSVLTTNLLPVMEDEDKSVIKKVAFVKSKVPMFTMPLYSIAEEVLPFMKSY